MQESSRDSKTISSTRGGNNPDVGNALLSFSVRWWWASDVYIGPADCYRGHREGNGLLTELNVRQCLLILIFIIPLSMGWRSCQTFQNIRLQWLRQAEHSGSCFGHWANLKYSLTYSLEHCCTFVEHCCTFVEHCCTFVGHCCTFVGHCYTTVETFCNIVEDWDQREG